MTGKKEKKNRVSGGLFDCDFEGLGWERRNADGGSLGGGGVIFTMRSSARAAIGVVAELVDVHAALGGGVVAGEVVGDGRWGRFGRLLEGDGPADFGVPAEDCDCVGGMVG